MWSDAPYERVHEAQTIIPRQLLKVQKCLRQRRFRIRGLSRLDSHPLGCS
jgi:hypothetical protein